MPLIWISLKKFQQVQPVYSRKPFNQFWPTAVWTGCLVVLQHLQDRIKFVRCEWRIIHAAVTINKRWIFFVCIKVIVLRCCPLDICEIVRCCFWKFFLIDWLAVFVFEFVSLWLKWFSYSLKTIPLVTFLRHEFKFGDQTFFFITTC